MPNHTEPQGPRPHDHEHHKECSYCIRTCKQCYDEASTILGKPLSVETVTEMIGKFKESRTTTVKRPTYKHTAKPPWVDFEKQRELVPSEESIINYSSDDAPDSPGIRLKEKLTTCRITFEDREPERSDSGKAITIHQCEVHLVIITWDES